MEFYISLFVYIISLVIGLVLMVAAKGISKGKFVLLSSLHGVLLLAFLASLLLAGNMISKNYFFMLFICSGVTLSGIAWRAPAGPVLRVYFSLFALTFPLFLLSPSMLLNFLLTMHYRSSSEPLIPLSGRYYLEKQAASSRPGELYKLIQKKGIFHSTLSRDLDFGGNLDSAKVLDIVPNEIIEIRAYSSRITYVSADIDSMDLKVNIKKTKQGTIEYKL